MKKLTTKEVQYMKLELLKKFSILCKKEGLQFFLAYGSLIGAVREKGYIAWDEDIDLYMFRNDIEKLEKLDSDILGSQYFIQSYKSDLNFAEPMVRICINGTYRCRYELMNAAFHKGTFIDIFPLDNVPENINSRSKQYNSIRKFIRILQLKNSNGYNNNIFKHIIKKLCVLLLGIIPKDMLKSRILDIVNQNKGLKTNLMCSFAGPYGVDRETLKKEWFFETVLLPFEDTYMPCPGGYDELLRQIYGDYMIPPSVENRKLDEESYIIE